MKNIIITCGDSSGIGPEILSRLIEENFFTTFLGSAQFSILGANCLTVTSSSSQHKLSENVTFVNFDSSTSSGAFSFKVLKEAITQCLKGNFDGLVTGPISKAKWAQDGFKFDGQTELLSAMTDLQPEMLFSAINGACVWRVLLLTRHIPIRQVPEALTFLRLKQAVHTLKNFLQDKYKIANPKIALAGLNPHAGEDGEIGLEEKLFWNDWANELGLYGPFSPDDIWYKSATAYLKGLPQEYDAYLAPYHDQALALIKTVSNFRAVNVSIGLPFVRTSPDHGTAFKLVGTGQADIRPFGEAIKLCVELS